MKRLTLVQKVRDTLKHSFSEKPNCYNQPNDIDARHSICVVADWLREEGFWQAADVLVAETVFNRGDDFQDI